MAHIRQIGANDSERRRNTANGAGRVFDFHPRADELRGECSVQAGTAAELFDTTADVETRVALKGPRYTVLSFDVAEHVFRDAARFSSEHGYGAETARYWGANILMMDEPGHRKYRALAQPAFAARTMGHWEKRWLAPMLDNLIDKFPASGPVDLYNDYCAPFPVNTIAMGFGIASEDVPMFHEWVNDPATGTAPMNEYLTKILAERRRNPDDSDVIGLLAQSEVEDDDGRHSLTDREVLGFANLMLTAGAGTTYRTMGVMLLKLLQHPDVLERVRHDRALIPRVVEETLRWSPPVPYFPRRAMTDTELAGVPIPAGSLIEVMVAAANRDPERWEEPHTWNPDRKSYPHVAFGFGPHFCIGNQLARMELQVALERLLERVPRLELDRSVPEPQITGLLFRMPTAVPAIVG